MKTNFCFQIWSYLMTSSSEIIRKGHVQLRFVVHKSRVFQNSDPNWGKLGSFVEKLGKN